MVHQRQVVLRGTKVGREFGARIALRDVDVDVRAGQCLAIIGGSGSGKSTLVRILLGLDAPSSGAVTYLGLPVAGRRSAGYRALRRQSGLVFQNPFASLDPRWTVGRSVAEPLAIGRRRSGIGEGAGDGLSGDELRRRAAEALALTGLNPAEFMDRYPSDLSGGQAQRVAIARAVVNKPKIIAADEPMSAIDVAARLRILDAFAAIRKARPETAIILVSHDLGVVQHIADRILVLHDGVVDQEGPTLEVLGHPQAAYTRRLVAAASL